MTAQLDRLLNVFRYYHAGETMCDERHFREKVGGYVTAGRAVPFVFMAFPEKSINEDSVSGYLPDFGEELAFQNLRDLVEIAGEVYAPGIELHIVSEGHCFMPTGCTRPAWQIDAYVGALKVLKGSDRISVYTIHDFYPQGDLEQKIADFHSEFMPTPLQVNDAIKNDHYYSSIYPHRLAFIYHEFSGVLHPEMSKYKRHLLSKVITRNFIGHQMGVNRLVQAHFADHVRLSIHQQHDPAAQKYYINLLPQVEGKGTPWFHIIKEENGVLRLAKRCGKNKELNGLSQDGEVNDVSLVGLKVK